MTDEPQLIVVREQRPNSQVAREILEAIQSNPHEHQVNVLAEKLDVPEDQIVHILHNYAPDGRGGVEQRPEGQGGGWLPDEVADQYRAIGRGEPVEIGYRWPDNQLRDEIFDFKNPDHRETVGLPPLEDEAPQE